MIKEKLRRGIYDGDLVIEIRNLTLSWNKMIELNGIASAKQGGEIPVTHRRGNYIGRHQSTLVIANSFIIDEKEKFVAFDRTAESTTEDRLRIRLLGCSGKIV